MNIIITQKNLNSALRIIERLVAKHISLPILGTVLLKTEGGQLSLTATNLEAGINYCISAKINQPGEVAVPVRVFSEFISNVTDEKLNLITNKNVLQINSEHYQTKILCLETKEFPLVPKSKEHDQITISSGLLRSAFLNVIEATALSDTRPELAGVYVDFNNKEASFAATDGFRLAEYIISIPLITKQYVIIPRSAAQEIIRLTEEEKELKLTISDGQLFIKGEKFE